MIAVQINENPMGVRKKNNQREALRRKEAKLRRDKKLQKRIAKGKTIGQKLADKMAGRA
jgi:hypothetical protein